MKPDIHPNYGLSKIVCACGNEWTTGGTVPEIHVELCNQCHPFFTGQQRIVDTLGRVERLRRRYATAEPAAASTSDTATAEADSKPDGAAE